MSDLVDKAKEELRIFERPSKATTEALIEEIQRLNDEVEYLQKIVDSDCEWDGSDPEDEGFYRKKEQGE